MSAAAAAPRMIHLGVLYDGADDLVDTVAPYVDRALDRGDSVSTLVDRRTSRGLREALGDRAGALTSASPHDGAPRAVDFLGRLRRMAADSGGRRTLVLAQYSSFAVPETELALGEAGINLVLGDLPLTVLCACARDAVPSLVDVVRHSHPGWAGGPAGIDNPAFRPPEDRSPTPSAVWGGVHVLRLHFGRTADLVRVRTHVAALAAEVGMHGEQARTAVFAVHEAAVVACDEVEDARALAPAEASAAADPAGTRPAAVRRGSAIDDSCVLDVWTAGSRLVARIHSLRADAVTAEAEPAVAGHVGGGADPRLPRDRLRMAGPLRLVRTFCRDVTTSETATSRTTRIVTGT